MSIDCTMKLPVGALALLVCASFGFAQIRYDQEGTVFHAEGAVWVGQSPERDGELTIFDFLAFQTAFDAGDPQADFDGDGELTIFDFLAFQNAFDAGCE